MVFLRAVWRTALRDFNFSCWHVKAWRLVLLITRLLSCGHIFGLSALMVEIPNLSLRARAHVWLSIDRPLWVQFAVRNAPVCGEHKLRYQALCCGLDILVAMNSLLPLWDLTDRSRWTKGRDSLKIDAWVIWESGLDWRASAKCGMAIWAYSSMFSKESCTYDDSRKPLVKTVCRVSDRLPTYLDLHNSYYREGFAILSGMIY